MELQEGWRNSLQEDATEELGEQESSSCEKGCWAGTCGHSCWGVRTPHPASSPLVSLLPGNQQLKMQPLKSLSALPALVWPPRALSSKSEQDQHPIPDFKTRDYAIAAWGWDLRQWGQQQSLGPGVREVEGQPAGPL